MVDACSVPLTCLSRGCAHRTSGSAVVRGGLGWTDEVVRPGGDWHEGRLGGVKSVREDCYTLLKVAGPRRSQLERAGTRDRSADDRVRARPALASSRRDSNRQTSDCYRADRLNTVLAFKQRI